jgi:hypothetical protein
MPSKNVVLALIDNLEPNEVRFLRRRLYDQKLALFNYLLSKKNNSFTENAGFDGFDPQFLATLRSQLEVEVARLIGEYRRANTPDEQIRSHRLKAISYCQTNAYRKAAKANHLALDMAIEIENYPLALEIAASIRLVPGHEAETDNRRYDMLELSRLDQEISFFRFLQFEAQANKALRGEIRRNAALQMLEKIEHIPSPKAVKSLAFHLRAMSICQVVLRDFEIALITADKINGLILNHPKILADPAIMLLNVASTLAESGILILKRQFEKAKAVLSIAEENLLMNGHSIPIEFELRKFRIALEDARNMPKEFEAISEQFTHRFETFTAASPQKAISVALMIAQESLTNFRPRSALRWTAAIDMHRNRITIPETIIVAGMVELFSLLLIEDWDQSAITLRNFKYLVRSKNQTNTLTGIFESSVQTILKHPTHKVAAMQKAAAEIDTISKLPELSFYFEQFGIVGWIEKLIVFWNGR